MQDSLVGKTVGQYEVLEQVIEFEGTVLYRAFQPTLDREVALKVLHFTFDKNNEFIERFRFAGQLLAKLEHPNILPVYDMGELDPEHIYFVLRLLHLDNLEVRIKNSTITGQPYALKDALRIIREIASAIDFAHSRGILHRDIKPRYIQFDEFGSAFLSDFLFASLIERSQDTDQVEGTIPYMAPERFYGKAATPASDQFALAATGYEIIAGHTPFWDEVPINLIRQIMDDPPAALQTYRPELPAAVDAVFARALAKRSSQRYPDARAFADALEDAFRYIGKKLRIFVSYSSRNRAAVDALVARLEEFGHSVWFDRELKNTGGQPWWDNILRQLQQADAFVFALTPDSLQSTPCQLEYAYAHDLNKRILPVKLADFDVDELPPPLAVLQWVDFTLPDGFLTLKNSLDNLPPAILPPNPMPVSPDAPL